MLLRSHTWFIVALIALAGFNLAELELLVVNYFTGHQYPDTQFFFVTFWLWAAAGLLAAYAGLVGGYQAIRQGNLSNPYLTAFCFLMSCTGKVDGQELGWSAVRLSFHLGFSRLALGVNVVGVGLLILLATFREQAAVAAVVGSGPRITDRPDGAV
jgi:hypothetical protein